MLINHFVKQQSILIVVFLVIILFFVENVFCKSIVFANYWNVVLFYPVEYGGNDDIRIIFDIRNITTTAFKYTPIIVDVAYESSQNMAFVYLESAITSYIVLIKWFGGKWCYQIMFEFESSTYSNYMYHSLVTLDNFVYWTSDRYIMSGRIPGYEKRRLMQPGWERVYRMTIDKTNRVLYVASYDFGENGIYACSINRYSCNRLTSTYFSINSIYYDTNTEQLYIASVQAQYLFRYSQQYKGVTPITNVQTTISDSIITNNFGLFVNRETIRICGDITQPNCLREAKPRLVDPYTLQYVFTFDHMNDFGSYPYPYSDFHDILWKDKQYLFHLHILGMDYVDNDYAFLPEMDLSNNFLNVQSCSNVFNDDKQRILIPSIIAGVCMFIVISIAILIVILKSSTCQKCRRNRKTLSEQQKGENRIISNLSTVSGSTSQQPLNNEKIKKKTKKSRSLTESKINDQRFNGHIPRVAIENQPKIHSSGIYIIGKNQSAGIDANSEISHASESHLNVPTDQKLRSKPLTKKLKAKFRVMDQPPLSIDSKRTYTDYLTNILSSKDSSTTTETNSNPPNPNIHYVSSCHIPLYGSSNTDNYISIKKAVNYSDDGSYVYDDNGRRINIALV